MPGLAAIVVAGLSGGRPEVKRLLARIARWRVGLQWYAIALFGGGALWGLAMLLGGELPELTDPIGLIALGFLVQLAIYLVFNQEELAWRGFALPRLQTAHGALKATLILGVVEGVFHLPLFFFPGSSQAALPLPVFLLSSLAVVFVYTWLFNNAAGSVLIVALFHAASNTWLDLFPASASVFTIFTLLVSLTALLCVSAQYAGARWRFSRSASIART
jgi:membrane protease YdiL (CAAX protease family)